MNSFDPNTPIKTVRWQSRCVTRKAFVDVYVRAVEAVRCGTSYAELHHLICGAITERGIGLCFGRHGRMLLKDICTEIGIHTADYGALFA